MVRRARRRQGISQWTVSVWINQRAVSTVRTLEKRACGVKVVCQFLCDKIHSFFSATWRLQVTIVPLRLRLSIRLICSASVKGWHWSGLDKDCVEKTREESFTKAGHLTLWCCLQRGNVGWVRASVCFWINRLTWSVTLMWRRALTSQN